MRNTTEPPPEPPEPPTPPHDSGAQKRVLAVTALIMAGVLLSRLLGLVRARVIAHQFGQGPETDLFVAAFTIPDVIYNVIAGGAIAASVIPVFTEYVARRQEREAWRIFSIVATYTFIVVGSLVVLGEIFTVPLTRLLFREFSYGKVLETAHLTRILLPAQILFFLGGLMAGVLQVKRNNWGQVWGSSLYNLGIIFGGVFLAGRMGVAGLCWGAVGGAVVGNFLLQWILIRRVGGVFVPDAFLRFKNHPGAKKVWGLMWPILFSLSLPQVAAVATRVFAASIHHDGTMSALVYANQLMQVPLGIFAQALGLAIFPTLSLQAAQKDMAALRRTTNFGIRFILFLNIPCSVLMIILSLPIVQLLLQTGKFKGTDAAETALYLSWFTVGLFAWSVQAIVARGFYSVKDSRTPATIGTLVTAVFLLANWILLHTMDLHNFLRAGSTLAMVNSFAAMLNTGILLFLLKSKLGGIEGKQLMLGVAKVVAASTAMGLTCWFVYHKMETQFKTDMARTAAKSEMQLADTVLQKAAVAHAAEILLVAGTAGVAVYAAAAFLLRMEEAKMFLRLVRRRPVGGGG